MDKFEKWCSDLHKYWLQKDIDDVLNLFTSDVIYYETPGELIDPKDLRELWNEVKEQEILALNYTINEFKNNIGNVSFTLEEKDRSVEMIYIVELNNENKCKNFMQDFEVFNRIGE